MRLHRLEVQALQAFAAREVVDFDALGAAGLFLLHGDTGAGKTTLLDAVCFALYGKLPGARGKDARERSDHAAPEVRTEVVLEVSLRGERLRITRTPKQERPKRSGEGTTVDAATVHLERFDDGAFRSVANRHEEVAHELDRLLGMNREQFCQVVLLPQGEFATFLRADSDKRWELLERLFATERFGEAEAVLTQRRKEAAKALEAARAGVRDVASRLCQETGSEAESCWEQEPVTLGPWLQERLVSAEASLITAASACSSAVVTRAEADRVLRAADAQALAARQHAEAVTELGRYEARKEQRDAGRAELWEARAAAGVAPLLEEDDRLASAALAADRTSAAAQAALERHAEVRASVPAAPARGPDRLLDDLAHAGDDFRVSRGPELSLFDPLPPEIRITRASPPEPTVTGSSDALRQETAALRSQAGAVRALAGTEADIAERQAALDAEQGVASAASARAAAAQERLTQGPARHAALAREFEQAQLAAAQLTDRIAAAQDAHRRREAARDRDRLEVELERQAGLRDGAIEAALAAKAHWLDVRERRLDGMAAELARTLQDGEACLVCGATEHPAPAVGTTGHLDADAERAAQNASETAEGRVAALVDRVAGLQAEVAAALARSGTAGHQELVAAAAQAERARDAAQNASSRVEQHRAALGAHDEEQQRLRAAVTTATEAAAAAGARVAAWRTGLEQDRAALRTALAGAPSVRERVAALHDAAGALEAAADALASARTAREAAAAARGRLLEAVRGQGFTDLGAARGAVRTPEHVASLEQRGRDFDDGLAERRARVQDPELLAAAEADAVDLEALRAAARRAQQAQAQADGAHAVAAKHADALRALEGQLAAALTALAPVAARAARVRDLAHLVDGSAAANRKRIRLSAYVLAARLEEIAAAATLRLGLMTGGRYALEHSDEGAKGQRRGGLDLRIVDGWTGRSRTPASLSGGETFLASLALALGLADVVAAESGGARLETLFVDEGFGSLDPASLDMVLDVLDRLRDGGRAVGIVSHVGELRQRIPTQLHVVRGRDGSHVAQPTAV